MDIQSENNPSQTGTGSGIGHGERILAESDLDGIKRRNEVEDARVLKMLAELKSAMAAWQEVSAQQEKDASPEAIQGVRERYNTAFQKVLNVYQGCIIYEARKFAGQSGVPIEDLKQQGSLALLEAVRHYDPGRGIPFVRFFRYCLRGKLKEWVMARGTGSSIGISLADQTKIQIIKRCASELMQELGRSPTDWELAQKIFPGIILGPLKAKWRKKNKVAAADPSPQDLIASFRGLRKEVTALEAEFERQKQTAQELQQRAPDELFREACCRLALKEIRRISLIVNSLPVSLDAPVNPREDGDRKMSYLERLSSFVMGVDGLVERREIVRLVDSAIARLSPNHREVVRLYLEGLNFSEIASRFGISRQAAHQNFMTAIKNIRKFLAEGHSHF